MRRLRLVALLALAACSASDDVPAPQLGSIAPDHGAPGSVIELSGSYFCQRPDTGTEDPTCATAGSVEFGTVPGIATSWADNAIQVEVPSTASGLVDVTVTAAGRVSNSATFTVE